MIGVIDCGMGNVQAFLNIYKRLNIEATAARTPDDIKTAKRLILPGVGAFNWAMEKFNSSGLRSAVETAVLDRKIPILGICIGMHMLARGSEEGTMAGLDWIPGEVRKFPPRDNLPLPHMGWNDVTPSEKSRLFAGLETEARFYFLHSYYFLPESDEAILAKTDYGQSFTSAVGKGHIMGVQFHPEKSHSFGIRLLQNFAEI